MASDSRADAFVSKQVLESSLLPAIRDVIARQVSEGSGPTPPSASASSSLAAPPPMMAAFLFYSSARWSIPPGTLSSSLQQSYSFLWCSSPS